MKKDHTTGAIQLRLRKNCCILLMPLLHCHAHLWREKRGESLGGGWVWKWDMMMDDDEMDYFLHFYMKAFWELEDNTVSNFCLYFLTLKLCAKILHFFERKSRTWRMKKWMIKIKWINVRAIRELLRERTIEQIQLIRGWLKNWKKWNHEKCNLIKWE